MSSLLILTRASLLKGFHLAGVEAWAADDIETAQELISNWLESSEVNLLAIDDGFLELMDTSLLRRLDASQNLYYIAIPGGISLGTDASRWHRISELIRHAVGFHIAFRGKTSEVEP